MVEDRLLGWRGVVFAGSVAVSWFGELFFRSHSGILADRVGLVLAGAGDFVLAQRHRGPKDGQLCVWGTGSR